MEQAKKITFFQLSLEHFFASGVFAALKGRADRFFSLERAKIG
jgi:hypothetical protein